MIVSGSWDETVKIWDARSPSPCVGTANQPERVYAMSVSKEKIVVGTAGRHIYIWDNRKLDEPLQRRESSLKFQTRCITCFPDGTGYAAGSIEGRVAIEYFDPAPEVQQKKYAFKCHRVTQNGVDTVYPVNSIEFNKV